MRRTIHRLPGRTHIGGFTLLELMITISILAILLGIAVPSFMSTIRSNQISATSNDLVAALNLARSEASKRGNTISICASSNGTNCTGAADWNIGWLVFTDASPYGSIESTNVPPDTVLNTYINSAAGMSIIGTDPAITYNPTGDLANSPAANPTFTITKSGCGINDKRTITVQITNGRSSLKKDNC